VEQYSDNKRNRQEKEPAARGGIEGYSKHQRRRQHRAETEVSLADVDVQQNLNKG